MPEYVDIHTTGFFRVTLRDAETGATAETSERSLWDWTEGNWSCDCNRGKYFGEFDFDSAYCTGSALYYVIGVDPMPDGYSLADFNPGYPSTEVEPDA